MEKSIEVAKEEQTIKEQTGNGQTLEEQTGNGQTVEEQIGEEQTSEEQAGKEQTVTEQIHFPMTPKEIRPYSALAFAYIGDSVFDTIVKTCLVTRAYNRPNNYHAKAIRYVSASAQTKMMKIIRPLLTDEEREIFRRGRNSKVISPAKNQSFHDYRIATGFEALIGYLYLLGRRERMLELICAGMAGLGEEE